MYRRAREREELIAEFEFRAATHVIDGPYEEDSDGDMFQEASMLAFAVRTVLESVREDKREDHPGRPDAYFLAMDPTHFEEVFRAERSDLVAISSRLRFPVDARGNVTDGDGHSATPLQACLVLFGRLGCQDDWKTLTPEFDRDRTWCVRCTAVCTHTQSHRAHAPRLKKIYGVVKRHAIDTFIMLLDFRVTKNYILPRAAAIAAHMTARGCPLPRAM
jgi:hypothetical protein